MTTHENPSPGEKFTKYTKKSLFLTSFLFIAGVVTAVSTLVTAALTVREWQNSIKDWRPAEYAKLAQLRAGYTTEKFRELLGPPLIRDRQQFSDNKYVENIFRPRPEYWVSVVSDDDGKSVSYVVTSCDHEFQPTFSFRSLRDRVSVTLNRTRYLNVKKVRDEDIRFKFQIGAPTGSDFVFATHDLGNQTSYRSYAWGVNDVCAEDPVERDELLKRRWEKWYFSHSSPTDIAGNLLDKDARRLLDKQAVNTYAETAPDIGIDEIYPLQIGVDRSTVRP